MFGFLEPCSQSVLVVLGSPRLSPWWVHPISALVMMSGPLLSSPRKANRYFAEAYCNGGDNTPRFVRASRSSTLRTHTHKLAMACTRKKENNGDKSNRRR